MSTIVVCQAGSLGQVQVMRLMHPNIDVIHLAGYLRHYRPTDRVHIVDGYFLGSEPTMERIIELDPDILFVHGDTPTATAIYSIATRYRMHKAARGEHACTILFGEHVSVLPEEAFARSTCDAILLGDPEPPALSLCEAWTRTQSTVEFAAVPNIRFRSADGTVIATTRNGSVVDLDTLPPAARDLLALSEYKGTFYKITDRETSILVARGCPWRCTFCGPAFHRAQQKPRFRFRSAVSIVDELERVQRDHGIDDFMLDITTFNFSPRWARELCEEIISRGLKVHLKTHLRADRIDPEMFRLMRSAGFWLIYLGIESANDRALAGVKKQITIAQVEDALQALKEADIKVVAELMNLLFWEEDGQLHNEGLRDAMATLSFARRMFRQGRIHAMYWTAMTPVPASESYDIAIRHDLIPSDVVGQWHYWFPIQRPIARLPGVSTTKWYVIQWLGKVHQTYFILRAGLLHRTLVTLVLKRAAQLVRATVALNRSKPRTTPVLEMS